MRVSWFSAVRVYTTFLAGSSYRRVGILPWQPQEETFENHVSQGEGEAGGRIGMRKSWDTVAVISHSWFPRITLWCLARSHTCAPQLQLTTVSPLPHYNKLALRFLPFSVGNQGELWERHAQKSLENQAPVTDIHSFFINSPTKEHLGCLWVLEIMNKVVINIQVQLFVWTHIFKSVG